MYFGIIHFLIARIIRGHGSHVAGSLNVILSAKRVHAASALSDFSADGCHIRKAHNTLGTARMLRNTKAVDNRGFRCRCIHSGRFYEFIGINMADLRNLFGSILLYEFFQFLIAFGKLINVIIIHQIFFYHDMHHAVD